MGTPSLCVVIDANRKAKLDEHKTVAASQKLDPSRRIDKNSDRNVRCIERYPRNMIAISSGSAFCSNYQMRIGGYVTHEIIPESTA